MENLDELKARILQLPYELEIIIWKYYWRKQWKYEVYPQLKTAIETRVNSPIFDYMTDPFVNYTFYQNNKSREDYEMKLNELGIKDYICKPLINYEVYTRHDLVQINGHYHIAIETCLVANPWYNYRIDGIKSSTYFKLSNRRFIL